MTDTATVETLTAEVRVLMVGNRQITLSVCRQLDVVPLEDMKPFGRINDGKRDGTYVVGKHRDTGALVTSKCERLNGPVEIFEEDLPFNVIVCDRATTDYHQTSISAKFGEVRVRFYEGVYERCGRHPYGSGECGFWDPNGQEDKIQALINEHRRRQAMHQDAASLPLIVLAGLR